MKTKNSNKSGQLTNSTKLNVVKSGSSKWTSGFFAAMFERGKSSTRDSLKMALWHPNNSASFNDFKLTARLINDRKKETNGEGSLALGVPDSVHSVELRHQGTLWGDGDCYKYMEGLSHLYAALELGSKRDEIKSELDELIELVASAQEDDGYINTQVQIPNNPRWVIRRHHEDYNFGHLFTASAVHFEATGERSFLDVASRAADCVYEHFINRRRDAGQFGWNPTHIPGLVDLYRATSESRYLDLACVFLDHRGVERSIPIEPPDIQGPDDQNQMAVAFRDETEAVGHAVTAAYLYQGAAEIYRETGDSKLLGATSRIWKDIVERKMYLTGAIGALPMGVSRRGFHVHEAFGREYELPHRTAYNETCANIAFGMFARSMLMLSGDATHADVMEQVIYNSGISGVSADGGSFCYANPLRSYTKWHTAEENVGTMGNFTYDRWKIHTCYCCPPQLFRFVAQLHDWAYYTAPKSIYVALYGSGNLKVDIPGAGLFRLGQKTDYPWDGRITFTVEEAPVSEVTLHLRVPQWSSGAHVTLNGVDILSVAKSKPGTFFGIARQWKLGDIVEMVLEMPVQLIGANLKVESCRGQVAIQRGPIVYCAEAVDLPKDSSLEDVAISRDFCGKTEFHADLLSGIAIVKGKGYLIPRTSGGLYEILNQTGAQSFELTLIPYFSWNNRRRTDMSVWFPVM